MGDVLKGSVVDSDAFAHDPIGDLELKYRGTGSSGSARFGKGRLDATFTDVD